MIYNTFFKSPHGVYISQRASEKPLIHLLGLLLQNGDSEKKLRAKERLSLELLAHSTMEALEPSVTRCKLDRHVMKVKVLT